MYALASPGRPWISRGVGMKIYIAKRSDLLPAVPLASLGFRLNCLGIGCTSEIPLASLGLRVFCVPGVGQYALLVGFA